MKRVSEEKREYIRELSARGVTSSQIMGRTGLSRTTVNTIIRVGNNSGGKG